MIAKKLTAKDLIGKTVFVLKKLRNRAGEGVSPGTIATIKNVVRGRGITIETAKSPCCGQFSCITGVNRNDLSLTPEFSQDICEEDRLTALQFIWKAHQRDIENSIDRPITTDMDIFNCHDQITEIK